VDNKSPAMGGDLSMIDLFLRKLGLMFFYPKNLISNFFYLKISPKHHINLKKHIATTKHPKITIKNKNQLSQNKLNGTQPTFLTMFKREKPSLLNFS
jgi:hypothetical protein